MRNKWVKLSVGIGVVVAAVALLWGVPAGLIYTLWQFDDALNFVTTSPVRAAVAFVGWCFCIWAGILLAVSTIERDWKPRERALCCFVPSAVITGIAFLVSIDTDTGYLARRALIVAEISSHSPEHFAITELRNLESVHRWQDLADLLRDLNRPIKDVERVQLQVINALVSDMADVKQDLQKWAASGYVGRTTYEQLIRRVSQQPGMLVAEDKSLAMLSLLANASASR